MTLTPASTATPTAPAPSPGTLDASFGEGGVVVSAFGDRSAVAEAVAVQSDGRIVVAGHTDTEDGRSQIFVARYEPDGALDTSFGTGGWTLTAPPPIVSPAASAIVLAPDGRIVVAGDAGAAWQVARYDALGRPDSAFGDGGALLVEVNAFSGPLAGLAVRPDGAILVAGPAATALSRFVVVRLRADGSRDESFGSEGVVTLAFGRQAFLDAFLVEPDGKIVVAGTVVGVGVTPNTVGFVLARLLPSGEIDPVFGNGGSTVTEISPGAGGAVLALGRLPDGGFQLAGYGASDPFSLGFFGDLAIVRYGANGTLDSAFGDGGVVRTSFAVARSDALASDTDGTLLVGRSAVDETPHPAAIVRLLPNGEPDHGFARAGVLTLHVRPDEDAAIRAFALAPDGRVLAVGYTAPPGGPTDVVLTRFGR